MTSPGQDGAPPTSGVADPTRDIRLPALSDRPPSVLPRAWAGVQPPRSASPADLQTDELAPPRGRSRERTIAFVTPEMARGRPTPTIGRTPRRPRRWPWIVLALLPLVVILGSGVWWLLLLRAS
jgi:hypothetical protein